MSKSATNDARAIGTGITAKSKAVAWLRLLSALLLAPVAGVVGFGVPMGVSEACLGTAQAESAAAFALGGVLCLEWTMIGVMMASLLLPFALLFYWLLLPLWLRRARRRGRVSFLRLSGFALTMAALCLLVLVFVDDDGGSFAERLAASSPHLYLLATMVSVVVFWCVAGRRNPLLHPRLDASLDSRPHPTAAVDRLPGS